MSALHVGQVLPTLSHLSMHLEWNVCEQSSFLVSDSVLTFDRLAGDRTAVSGPVSEPALELGVSG